jgi:metal-responsive CopG/Arc/MetJ family transcriptional regulator
MPTNRTVSLPDDLITQIEGTVARQGKSVDQWIEETLRAQLEERSWQDLLEYGRRTGLESGYTEASVPELVKQWRREQRSR